MTELFGSDLGKIYGKSVSKIKSAHMRMPNENEEPAQKVYPWKYVDWEGHLWKDKDGVIPNMFFDNHIGRINKSGYERSPTPQEYYSFAIAALDHGAFGDVNLENVAEEMRTLNKTEFFCHGASRRGDTLNIYTYVKDFVWEAEGGEYLPIVKEWCSELVKFDIPFIKDTFTSLIDIHAYRPDLIEHFYSKPLEDLPEKLQNGRWVIPKDDRMYMMGRGRNIGDLCFNLIQGASRGVYPI